MTQSGHGWFTTWLGFRTLRNRGRTENSAGVPMKLMATVREAVESDLPAILAIYNEVIATSTAVYALEPSTVEDRRIWFSSRCASGFPILVALSAPR